MTKKHLHTESKSKKYNLIQFRLLFLALWFPVEGAGPGGTTAAVVVRDASSPA